ncbi:hypothetical protein MKX07_007743 [Trichoderma sp. CBMAI-0711]|nr:hypothetical protein MKX07_007743 [Trichoderma sp. CBMAI-0711]
MTPVAGAAGKLLVAGGAHQNGVVQGSLAARVEGAHVEDVDALHLSENLETLETGGLLEVGGDGAGLGAGAEEVVLGLDLCNGSEEALRQRLKLRRDALHAIVDSSESYSHLAEVAMHA